MERGDQIAVPCSIRNVEYYHFGIYLGATVGVAEFGDGCVRVVDLFAFKGDSILVRAVYQPGQCLVSEVVAQKAEDLVNNPRSWGTYDLITKNCEHFATYCKTGTAFSLQVEHNTLLGKVWLIKQD